MIILPENKHVTYHKSIESLPLPQNVYVPISQHIGASCDVLEVKAGDTVKKGQKIASSLAKVFSPIHSPLSGKVTAVKSWPHPVLERSKTIIIESDGTDKPWEEKQKSEEEVSRLTPDEIRRIIMEAGIVGMGGAAFPAHLKLSPPKAIDTFIINCAECEPYLTADFRLMVEKTKEILSGAAVAARCLGTDNIIIAIEDNKPEAIEKFSAECVSKPRIKVKSLKSSYPQGGEKQLIKNILRKEVPRGKLPFEVGVVVHNAGTVFAIYEAVYKNKPLYERVVTVSGNCLANPKNLLVRIGTPLKNLIEFCGPLKEEPAKIITGGPMMGLAQYTDIMPVIKSTSGIILFSKKEAVILEESACIRCSACVKQCPLGLMPCMINLAAGKELWEQAGSYGALDCIECGCCSYVCPANRHLVQSIRRAKLELSKQK